MPLDHENTATRERILSTAAGLFASHGYCGTRLHDIASAVGIQKPSLFHYFASKADIYRAALERGVAEIGVGLRAAFEGERTPEDRLRDLISVYVGTVAQQPERAKLLLRLALGDAPMTAEFAEGQRLVAAVADFIAEGQQSGTFRPLDPVALVLAVVGMVAFFFTTAEILSPAWEGNAGGPARVERIVTEMAIRALRPGSASTPSEPVALSA